MITWYSDDEIIIKFSEEPHIDVQYIKPTSTKEERKNIYDKPFILKNKIKHLTKKHLSVIIKR